MCVSRSWSVSAALPPRSSSGEYVINHITDGSKSATLPVTLTVYGNRPVTVRVRSHFNKATSYVAELVSQLPDWVTLDPHGDYVAVEVNETFSPISV